MTNTDILKMVDHRIIGVNLNTKLSTVITLMKNMNVEIIPIMEGKKLVGILNDRRVAEYTKRADMDLYKVKAGDIMAKPLFVKSTDSVNSVLDYFIKNRISRVPVVNNEKDMECVGVISATEVLEFKMKESKKLHLK
ncbi:MAG: CBS domain-containing protein [Candidatus Micrarchaeia archaeon]